MPSTRRAASISPYSDTFADIAHTQPWQMRSAVPLLSLRRADAGNGPVRHVRPLVGVSGLG
ncbi:hypothetical protein [Streptomyces sp. NPDC053755]|uniref:hypothetical protein n=1 Tax=Streptomyces sp. NPDC053755 TaxID=3155815 RepID=UPI00343FCE1D